MVNSSLVVKYQKYNMNTKTLLLCDIVTRNQNFVS